jgi:diaminopimelate epimerase
MKRAFTKMHGCGNDYIYFNCLSEPMPNPEKVSRALSDRHFGIGGDGIVLICPSGTADAKMRMFNADGSEGKMCGNAIRCVGKYLYDNKLICGDWVRIETLSGVKVLQLFPENGLVKSARVDMGPAELCPARIPACFPGERAVDVPLTVEGREHRVTCVSMGNPHCVVFVPETSSLDLNRIGPGFEKHSAFPEQVNTEFVRVIDSRTLEMRVWERGSGETWACGTGACAAAVAAVENGFCPKGEPIAVRLRGGELVIEYTERTVFMTGSAVQVFEGIVELPF